MKKIIKDQLFQFSFIFNFQSVLDDLERLAISENWKFRENDPTKSNQNNPILQNYLCHTFERLVELYNDTPEPECYKWFSIVDDSKICFNSGLYTTHYNEIFMYFVKNDRPGLQDWKFNAFVDESDPRLFPFSTLPKRATYFKNINELMFDSSLDFRVNSSHILSDPDNLARIPESVRNKPNLLLLFNGAIEITKKRINLNYKTAVPQFFENKIQLLIPICLEDPTKTDLVLVVSRINDVYIGHTCLTLDMAYNNARLITKPEAEWLAR